MTEIRRKSIIKPTVDTPFNIDFEWWQNHDQNWKVYLYSFLCKEHQEIYSNEEKSPKIDWVDPVTAEVTIVDGIQHTLMNHCAKQPDFFENHTTIVNTIFGIFLSNGNKPLTPDELSSITGKSAVTILRTLSGPQVYRGIRPAVNR
jgi:intracellular septation protein A